MLVLVWTTFLLSLYAEAHDGHFPSPYSQYQVKAADYPRRRRLLRHSPNQEYIQPIRSRVFRNVQLVDADDSHLVRSSGRFKQRAAAQASPTHAISPAKPERLPIEVDEHHANKLQEDGNIMAEAANLAKSFERTTMSTPHEKSATTSSTAPILNKEPERKEFKQPPPAFANQRNGQPSRTYEQTVTSNGGRHVVSNGQQPLVSGQVQPFQAQVPPQAQLLGPGPPLNPGQLPPLPGQGPIINPQVPQIPQPFGQPPQLIPPQGLIQGPQLPNQGIQIPPLPGQGQLLPGQGPNLLGQTPPLPGQGPPIPGPGQLIQGQVPPPPLPGQNQQPPQFQGQFIPPPPLRQQENRFEIINGQAANSSLEQLGCGFDWLTNSCKDLFNIGWCGKCHDFGNIFVHDCKCIQPLIALPPRQQQQQHQQNQQRPAFTLLL